MIRLLFEDNSISLLEVFINWSIDDSILGFYRNDREILVVYFTHESSTCFDIFSIQSVLQKLLRQYFLKK